VYVCDVRAKEQFLLWQWNDCVVTCSKEPLHALEPHNSAQNTANTKHGEYKTRRIQNTANTKHGEYRGIVSHCFTQNVWLSTSLWFLFLVPFGFYFLLMGFCKLRTRTQRTHTHTHTTMSSPSQLEQLAKFTQIVADTGDINSIKKFKPQDSTTNPSLLLKASNMKEYQGLIADAIAYARKWSAEQKVKSESAAVTMAVDRMGVNFGTEILSIVPGVVSTEVDARLSFDVQGTVAKARKLIRMYKEKVWCVMYDV